MDFMPFKPAFEFGGIFLVLKKLYNFAAYQKQHLSYITGISICENNLLKKSLHLLGYFIPL